LEIKTNKSKIQKVDWEDPTLKRWLDTITHKTTVYTYRTSFRAYAKYTGMTATQLIDEAIEDFKRDPREREDIVLKRLTGFYDWLQNDYKILSRGKGKHKVVSKGTTVRSAVMRVNVIRSFYSTFGINVKMKGRHKLSRGRVKNKRMIVSAEQVKALVQHARTIRDRAIILVNFQGGLDASTICSLNYEDVAQGIENGETLLKLELVRPKTVVEYYTFLGKDAITALKAYITDQKARGTKWTSESPLFTKERRGTDERITTNLIQNMMKEVAILAGFVDKQNNGKDFNILGPHALRESFSSIMLNAGVPKPIVDFWLGHAINGTDEAYMTTQFDRTKEMYSKREHLLSISASTEKEEELRKIKDSIADIEVDKQDMKAEIAKLKSQLEIAVLYINSLEFEQKERKLNKEAQEDFNNLVAELNKTHPVPKKVK
jgi:integrase